ncbi:hypothetical protein IQ215_10875 [Cyanobacterium stanieri LEGE 03274]|uniref:Uncharacterized protein n=1 Tax=Cyanobacterium stanieri LEGE 03274 TaxID=1828756 RepID=A0ABR9V5M3_9CHRO|nr:hypothetical protein [Cyanobacterium stanieri]MBE9223199.1 hypothetical protein [Cyanobacterium stanieri LEGE 03274]
MLESNLINLEQINQPIQEAKPEVQKIIEQVLVLERERLYNKNKHHINDDIVKIIKQNIQ